MTQFNGMPKGRKKKWEASLMFKYQDYYLGRYETQWEAELVETEAIVRVHSTLQQYKDELAKERSG